MQLLSSKLIEIINIHVQNLWGRTCAQNLVITTQVAMNHPFLIYLILIVVELDSGIVETIL